VKQSSESIADKVSLERIRYANCWEDTSLLIEALQPAPGMRILSIASGGDNSLALAAEGAEVMAVDLSVAQLACVELKMAAIRRLDHDAVLRFLGVRDSENRSEVYRVLAPRLSETARNFLRGHPDAVLGGIIHAGRFERYFRLFRRYVLRLVHSGSCVAELMREKDEAARNDFYERKWNNRRWRMVFRIFFSRFMMGRLGRDPEFFRYVEGSVADRILTRVRYALTELPTHANPYLEYILTGNFSHTLPWYLEPSRFDAVRDGLHRITLRQGAVEDFPGACGSFDGFNLSDVFEYMSPDECENVYGALLRGANPGARFAYWNMLTPRRCPDSISARVISLDDLSEELFRRDLAFFYSAFVVEEAR